ncbi:TatD family hydrolase [Photobacterium atrarenae]|uniref:TatD family hydrolase n=2 Tax=Photobacterium atrarenae TaxID=865757 RepID=A0ABY5GJ54_9GAMM|nr:TatD family hydrolase [Photobacterium atrarenae]UTV29329.1 TatD family hydrolase [Photobacterium atrarenae]
MMIDSHCHFDFAPFDADPAGYLAMARQAGVAALVIPSVGERNWQRVQALSHQYDGVYYALGLHPFFSAEHREASLELLAAQLAQVAGGGAQHDRKCVAVGECGLDFAIAEADRDQQLALLQQQLILANTYQLPVILHCRKAFPELVSLLKQYPPVAGGVYHGFSGSLAQAQQVVALGLKIGVGGTITYPRANKTRKTVAALPLEALVLETDAPDMPVAGHQGEPNRPDRLCHVLQSLVALRSESPREIESVTRLTTTELFRLSL